MRKENWPELLADHIENARHQPFEWGRRDCCMFANGVYCSLTGYDIAAEFRGSYKTAAGAVRALKKRGFNNIRQVVTHFVGDEINPKFAQRGDLVLIIRDGQESLGVCVGNRGAFVGMEKLEFLPMSEAVTAWRVS